MHYNSLNEKLKRQFGCKVYKLSLSGGMTCPNRDGTIGTRGCIFCSEKGSGDFAEPLCEDIFLQIERARGQVAKKVKNAKYIAYFQSFTNTYAPVEHLRKTFKRAISHPDIVALSIATRPDCLGKEVLELLAELAKEKPLWVELGLQTANEKTAEYIRRGYKNGVYLEAVKNLHKIGAEVITHIILGLPGEDITDMLKTVRLAAAAETDGVKLQLLHILKGTDLAADYAQGKFKALSLEEYADILCRCIEALPENTVIHRLTGDGDKRLLIAPEWSADKKTVLNAINKRLGEKNIAQGSKAEQITV
ncbi:MAG: TIGR01212 family radical SAM protein [Clostridia bacterium]|nr:TIGR01212 family radical SAM protein [Clostridia bacterium]